MPEEQEIKDLPGLTSLAGLERIEVTLKKTHTHAGISYTAGEKITISIEEMLFLEQHKVI